MKKTSFHKELEKWGFCSTNTSIPEVLLDLSNAKVGDKVLIIGLTGFATGGEEIITNIKTKYNETSGKLYKVICCGDEEYDIHGNCVHGYSGYAIEKITKHIKQ